MIEPFTAQKMKFSIKDFFSKCDQIRSFLGIWSYLLKKSLMKNVIFFVVFSENSYLLIDSYKSLCQVYLDKRSLKIWHWSAK